MDSMLLMALQSIRLEGLNQLMVLITVLGDDAFIWIVLALFMMLFVERRQTGALIIIGCLLCFILGDLILGNIVARPRPCDLAEGIVGFSALMGVPHEGFSFPSGHASTSCLTATIVFLTRGRKEAIPVAIAALIMCFSRLYVGANWPSDVLFGMVFGVVLGALIVWVYNRFFGDTRHPQPKGRHSL